MSQTKLYSSPLYGGIEEDTFYAIFGWANDSKWICDTVGPFLNLQMTAEITPDVLKTIPEPESTPIQTTDNALKNIRNASVSVGKKADQISPPLL